MNKKFTSESILVKTYQSISSKISFFLILVFGFTLVNLFLTLLSVDSFGTGFVISLIIVFVFSKLAIMVHRSILLNEFEIKNMMSWSIIEIKFTLWVIGVYMLIFVVGGILMAFIIPFIKDVNNSFIYGTLMIVFQFFTGLIISRLSLIFPGVAIGENISMSKAWQASRGHVVSLFILISGVPFLTNLILSQLPTTNNFWIILSSLITSVVAVFEVAILTHCYQALFNHENETEHSM